MEHISTAERFSVERTSMRCRVRAWQLHDIDGITWRNDRHSPAFRMTVVQAVPNEELSMREVAARFNISTKPSSGTGGMFTKTQVRKDF